MDKKLPLVSYALAAMSGICFMSGLFILSNEGGNRDGQIRGDYLHARSIVKHET